MFYTSSNTYLQNIITVFFAVFFIQFSTAQNNTVVDTVPFVRFGNISTKFVKPSFELKKGNIISNVLKVVSHDNRVINFTVDALFPGGWSRIDDANKVYTIRKDFVRKCWCTTIQ